MKRKLGQLHSPKLALIFREGIGSLKLLLDSSGIPGKKSNSFLKKNCCNLTQYLWQSKVTQAYTPGWKLRHKQKPQFINLPLVSMSEAHLSGKKTPKLDDLLIYERWETFIIIFFKYLNNQIKVQDPPPKYQMEKGLYAKGGWGGKEGCFYFNGRKKIVFVMWL